MQALKFIVLQWFFKKSCLWDEPQKKTLVRQGLGLLPISTKAALFLKNLSYSSFFYLEKKVPLLREKNSCINSHLTCTYQYHLNQFLLLSGSTSVLLPNSPCSISAVSVVSGCRGQRQAHVILCLELIYALHNQLSTKIWLLEISREITKQKEALHFLRTDFLIYYKLRY